MSQLVAEAQSQTGEADTNASETLLKEITKERDLVVTKADIEEYQAQLKYMIDDLGMTI